MSWFSFLDPAFDFVFGPLLKLHPFWSILILSFVIAVIIVYVYKWTTNQQEMKALKDEISGSQKKMKELRDKPEEMMKIQKSAMNANMKYMMHSFKPTLITFLPIILIFGWMNTHLAFEPIHPGEEFSILVEPAGGYVGNVTLDLPPRTVLVSQDKKENTFTFTLKSGVGKNTFAFAAGNKTYFKEVIVDGDGAYSEPTTIVNDDTLASITTNNKQVYPIDLGFVRLNWLWSYLILSLVFSIGMRKILKVY